MLYPETTKRNHIKSEFALIKTKNWINVWARYGGWTEPLPKWLEVIW